MIITVKVETLPPHLFITVYVGDRMVIRFNNSTPKPLETLVLLLESLIYGQVQHIAKQRQQATGQKMSLRSMANLLHKSLNKYRTLNAMLSAQCRLRKKQEKKPAPT